MRSVAAKAAGELTTPIDMVQRVTWGRTSNASWDNNIGAALMVAFCPIWMIFNWATLEYFDGSATDTIRALGSVDLIDFAENCVPRPSGAAFAGYAAWLLWQAFLYGYLPGVECFGQRTPGGNLLRYCANGLMAWALTHLLFLAASMLGYLDPAIIAKHWEGLLFAANTYGFVLAILAQLKGYWAPSFPEDRKLSGSWIFDFWGGVELNPRFGQYWDFKFFHNGRPGIVAWTLIDLSWAAYQYQTQGAVTPSMLIVLLLHTIYVVDFFHNEDWYTRTVDITHDHFGFMLAWGDTSFLPAFYTLQVQFLARYPTHLSTPRATAILALGIAGYAIFRSANHQKDHVRARAGNATLWGRPAEFIRAPYHTSDGKQHTSLLVTSGWWGVCRHANYLADLTQAFAMCATCGFDHVLPWSYFFFMTILLVHRAERDERRCRSKYGKCWEAYCEKVPYRLVPGVF